MRSRRPTSSSRRRACSEAAAFQIEFVGQQHIFESRERLDELVRLKDEADLAPAHRGQLGLGQIVDGHAIEPDFAFAGRVETGEQP